jgi:hypothetical protein
MESKLINNDIYNLNNNGYVLAGVPTLYGKYTKDNFQYKRNVELIGKNTIRKGLFSYGTELYNLSKRKTKPKINNYNEKTHKQVIKINEKKELLTPDMKLFLDSGGFQAIRGYLTKEEMKDFAHQYTEYLEQYPDDYDYAFILDLPAFDKGLKDDKDIYDLNKYSYEQFHKLPKEVQNKIIYVYHFNIPRVNNIWYRFFEEGLVDGIDTNYFSVGGLVGRTVSETILPYINYSLPLYNIVRYQMLNRNRYQAKFHVLGVGTYYLGIFFAFLQKLLKDKYNFQLDMTFDSTSPIKHLGQMRIYNVFNDYDLLDEADSLEDLLKIKMECISLASQIDDTLHRIEEYDKLGKNRQRILNSIHWMDKHAQLRLNKNIEDINIDKIYNTEGGYTKQTYLIMMMYDCYVYDIANSIANRVIEKSGINFADINNYSVRKEISDLVYKLLDNLTPNKNLNVYKKKIVKSLELFSDLNNPNKANSIIDNYLHVDESIKGNTDNQKSLMTFNI